MAQILGNLSYNNKTLKPIGRPVEDLKELYKAKKDDYNYVIDSLNATETALNQVQFIGKDKGIVDTANAKFQETLTSFDEQGDFENRIVDTKRLANDLTNKYGLLRVQGNAQARGSYITGLQDMVDAGKMSRETMEKYIEYSDRNYEGITKNKVTGGYTGTYIGRTAQPWINVGKETIDIVKGIKSSTIMYKGEDGKQGYLVRSKDGKGYLIAGSDTYVSQEQVEEVAKNYIEGNELIQSQYNEDIFLELDKITQRKELTTEDLVKTLRNKATNGIIDFLGKSVVPTSEELDKLLEEKGVSKEEAYALIRKEQMMDTDIRGAIAKETFRNENVKFLQDYQLKNKTNSSTIEKRSYEVLSTYDNVQNFTSKDIINSTRILEETKVNLELLKKEQKELKNSPNAERSVTVDAEITRQTLIVNDLEEQQSRIFENVNMDDLFKKYDVIDELSKGFVTNISKLELRGLIYEELNGTLSDETLKQRIEKNTTEEQWKETQQRQPNLIHLIDTFEKYKTYRTNLLGSRVRHATKEFKKLLDSNDKEYIDQYKTPLFNNLSAKESLAHPLKSLWDTMEGLPNDNALFYTGMTGVKSGKSLKSEIEESYDLGKDTEETGKINWKTAKVVPRLTTRRDNLTQNYRPALTVEVDIDLKKDGKTRTIVVPVFADKDYEQRFKEQLVKYRQSLVNISKTRKLSPSEESLLNESNLSLYNLTSFGTAIDLKNLYATADDTTVPIKVNDNLTLNVRTFKDSSPSGQAFYITLGEKDNAEYAAIDLKTNTAIWIPHNNMIKPETKERIRNGELSMLGGNTVRAIKEVFAEMTFSGNSEIKDISYNEADLEDISNNEVLKNRISTTNTFESTKINKDIVPRVEELFIEFPNIKMTDISRNPVTNVEGSALDSAHKLNQGAHAIDIRANGEKATSDEAKAINALKPTEKAKRGIKLTKLHGEGNNLHLHIEFIKD